MHMNDEITSVPFCQYTPQPLHCIISAKKCYKVSATSSFFDFCSETFEIWCCCWIKPSKAMTHSTPWTVLGGLFGDAHGDHILVPCHHGLHKSFWVFLQGIEVAKYKRVRFHDTMVLQAISHGNYVELSWFPCQHCPSFANCGWW